MSDVATADEWQLRALCRGMDPDVFFAESADPRFWDLRREAEETCAACPVRGDCLAYAYEHRIGPGFWGGQSENTRRHVLKSSGARLQGVDWVEEERRRAAGDALEREREDEDERDGDAA